MRGIYSLSAPSRWYSTARFPSLRLALLFAALPAVLSLFVLRFPAQEAAPQFTVNAAAPGRIADAPRMSRHFVTHGETREVHAATATLLPGGDLLAFWYGGTREGAGDVSIYSARFGVQEGVWHAPRLVVDRTSATDQLHRYIRKLGNAVVFRPKDQILWLFYVTVSVGGWAGSSINLISSHDGGESWGESRRLVTSPFLNLSTLVKGPAIRYEDGTFGLPVYHEFIGKFGELLRLDASGEVIGKQRLSHGAVSLQPVIAPFTPEVATGLMRYAGPPPNRILEFATNDGGAHWSAPVRSELPNPNSAVSMLRLGGDELLVAFNNSEEERDNLTLAISADRGIHWRIAAVVEDASRESGRRDARYSYPWLVAGEDGLIHLLYTWHKQRIRHLLFNRAWLDGQGSAAGEAPS